jgi:predicted PurR-regulated permease PerM
MPALDSSHRYRVSITVAVWIIAVVAAVMFLRAASAMLIPIVLAILISYALEPVVAWMVRHRLPRLLATTTLMGSLLGLCGWGVYSLRDEARQAVAYLPEAARRLHDLVAAPPESGSVAGSIAKAREELRKGSSAGSASESGAQNTTENADDERRPAATDRSAPPGGSLLGSAGMRSLVEQGLGSVLIWAGNIVVIAFLVFFLLSSGHHFRDRLVEIAGPALERRQITASVLDEINAQVQRFLLVRLITATGVGAATWAVLAWMGVQNAAVWGILAGAFNSIPYFGPVIVSGGLLLVGLVQGGGLTQALQMSGAALVVTSLEGWLLTPPLLGKAERMSALTVFIGILLWTWIWGAWGTILAVPMLVILKTIGDRVEPLKPIGRLMAP